MILAPNNTLKDMRKNKPIKQNSIEKAKKKKKNKENRNLFV